MSYQGSPYYSSAAQEDYEFDDERYDDEDDRENDEPQDESDEDTEEASETELSRHEEPYEIKEQMYQDKLAMLKKKLQQLKDGTHHEYNKRVRKLEYQYKERLRLNVIFRDYMIECVERDYVKERNAADKEFEEKKIDLKENLLSDFEDKRKTIEAERYSLELTGDSMEVKTVLTRKLRRRPNDPVPVPEKRRKPPVAQITHLLDEKEIENDLKVINRGEIPSTSNGMQNQNLAISSNGNDVPLVEAKIADGKLLYERRWFHRGQSVYIEGRDMAKFPARISAIGHESIWVKKADNSRIRIYVASLARGRFSIKRRAS
ncbi:sin3 histone deacetylase corepressor complex component SDS3 [Agrilus planipennis]|uniref:Sin3 histone deacetylase corepressor complex component SDS3 n=1 Tax=Agrilus planipennis TaxID=224129 RepID=A0A1W4W898_AGRPL|nr:sin3 histone deacetylase corepressor complex component SDS3 [Agrilus planipennis]